MDSFGMYEFMLCFVFGWTVGLCLYCYGTLIINGVRWIRKKLKARRGKPDA